MNVPHSSPGRWIPPFAVAAWLAALCLAPAATGAGPLPWKESAGGRWAAVTPGGSPDRAGFTRLPAAALGIDFANAAADERTLTNRVLVSGAGVACGDFDGDGWCDLFFCGTDVPGALYRNLGGWRFTNVTAAALPPGAVGRPGTPFDGTGAAFADVDGDGRLDLLVNSLGGGARLFHNQGDGTFRDATDEAGLRTAGAAMSLALADVNGDGFLDIYVCNYRRTTVLDRPTVSFQISNKSGRREVAAVDDRPVTDPDLTNRFRVAPTGAVLEFAEEPVLWLNDGHGRFSPVPWTGGAFLDESGRPLSEPPRDWGLACRFGDLNADGRPDLYACNDLHTPDRVWLNESTNGAVRFRALPLLAMRNNATFSMGVDFGDLNRDGFVDLFNVDMFSRRRSLRFTQLAGMEPRLAPPGAFEDREQLKRNALQLNRGDGTFAEAAWFAGVEAAEWSWGPVFLDVDLDGYEDILIANGQVRDFQDADGATRIEAVQRAAQAAGRKMSAEEIAAVVKTLPRLETPKLAFRNLTGGRGGGAPRFEEAGAKWGFDWTAIAQGMALADLDNDGDLDVVMNAFIGEPGIFRNEAGGGRVLVRLRGDGPNSRGVGAKITVRGGPVPEQTSEMIAGGRYLSGDDPARMFASGASTQLEIEVAWPSGRRSRVSGVASNQIHEVFESKAAAGLPRPPSRAPARMFEEAGGLSGDRHEDEPFDDTSRQPGMPWRLSQLGPGVAWGDVNGDGWDDLIVGAGRSGKLAVYVNDGRGGLIRSHEPQFEKAGGRDLTTVLPLGPYILAGSANWEDGRTNGGYIRVFDGVRRGGGESILGQEFSVGPMALADVDGDGRLDLFLGGRAKAGRWPEPADSLLMRGVQGKFELLQRFPELGLASGACFTDLEGNGKPALAVACEWGPLRLFRWNAGKYESWDPPVEAPDGRRRPLSAYTGFWTSVTAVDLDGNGRMDLAAGNWGLNTKYRAEFGAPRRLYYGDLGGFGPVDVVEATVDGRGVGWPDKPLPLMAQMFPWVRERFSTAAAFAQATLEDVFGDRLAGAKRLEATWLASSVLLNLGDHFELRPMPDWAQLSPVFGLVAGDYDGDGLEDLFVAQNWDANEPFSSRNDAGRGLWMRGDGKGGLSADPGSGVEVYGDGRGAAAGDYDGDGRLDLAVGQNGAATKLWHNIAAAPGLRVRLISEVPPASAAVRLRYGERPGPWREWHLGGGYWSVDSAVCVLGKSGAPTAVEVRWPGGAVTTSPLTGPALEVAISPDGRLAVKR